MTDIDKNSPYWKGYQDWANGSSNPERHGYEDGSADYQKYQEGVQDCLEAEESDQLARAEGIHMPIQSSSNDAPVRNTSYTASDGCDIPF